jgi:hypothetical protein
MCVRYIVAVLVCVYKHLVWRSIGHYTSNVYGWNATLVVFMDRMLH